MSNLVRNRFALVFVFAMSWRVSFGGVDFTAEIVPILKANCWSCHSKRSDRPKADLILDDVSQFQRAIDENAIIEPGEVRSYFVELISAQPGSVRRMPPEDGAQPLTGDEIDLLTRWVREGAKFGDWKGHSWEANVPFEHVPSAARNVDLAAAEIDRLIEARLKAAGKEPESPVDDATFLRRLSLDIGGRIPTLEEVESFLSDPAPNKRAAAITRILNSPAYVSRFANYWADALRVKEHKGYGAAFYTSWIKKSLRENLSYDQFVRELLTATGNARRHGAAGFHLRDDGNVMAKLEGATALFLGTDMSCAQCHDDPYDGRMDSETVLRTAGLLRRHANALTPHAVQRHRPQRTARFHSERPQCRSQQRATRA